MLVITAVGSNQPLEQTFNSISQRKVAILEEPYREAP